MGAGAYRVDFCIMQNRRSTCNPKAAPVELLRMYQGVPGTKVVIFVDSALLPMGCMTHRYGLLWIAPIQIE